MQLKELFTPDEIRTFPLSPTTEISYLACHTGQILSGSLWFCIPGSKVFPLPLLATAARRGALAAVVPDDCEIPTPPLPLLRVKDIRLAVANTYHRFYRQPGNALRLYAVTGTNGKTTTASMLAHLLTAGGRRCGMIGTVGCFLDGAPFPGNTGTMTTPPPEELYPILAAMKDAGATDVVMEISSHAIVQKRVAPLRFDIGIFTNLSPEHLDYHGTMEAYAEAKSQLFSLCERAVYDAESHEADYVCRYAPEAFPCGTENTFFLHDVRLTMDGTSFSLETTAGKTRIFLPVLGKFMAKNAMLALRAAEVCGIPISTSQRAMSKFRGVRGRTELLDLSAYNVDFSVMIDFAHTEVALREALLTAREITQGRVILVFGCGGDRDPSKRAPMGRIAEALADVVIVTSDNSRTESPGKIIKDILGGMRKNKHRVIVNREGAIRAAIHEAQTGDMVLLAGKGHEAYEISDQGILPFDEEKIVFSALDRKFQSDGGNTNKGGAPCEFPSPRH